MTERFYLAGDVSSALTQFAAYGLALLAEEEFPDAQVSLSYTQEARPRAVLDLKVVRADDVAVAVRDVAQRWSQPDAWAQKLLRYPDGKKSAHRSPFSPRIKGFEDEETWLEHVSFRAAELDRLVDDHLALQFIHGLGEAAYWRKESNSPRPDDGASRWEMKTRNRGEEFIANRFAGLVKEVATWAPQQILNGLAGTTLNDVIGKQKADSRTSTGLTRPQPVDNALALVALLGMSLMPPIRDLRGISITPGAYPRRVTHPRWMVLPVPIEPTTVDRMRSIMLSAQFDHVAEAAVGQAKADSEMETAGRAWLRSRNIAAVSVFQIFKGGSSSAPERQVLDGTLVIL